MTAVVAWGIGSLGDTGVPTGLSNVIAVAVGELHGLALVNDGSPVVRRQSSSQTAYTSINASFTVQASGPPPLNYQWQFNGANIAGATNAFLG